MCLSSLNETRGLVLGSLRAFNARGNLRCYPSFHHAELSDVLLRARELLERYEIDATAWSEYMGHRRRAGKQRTRHVD